MSLRSHAKECIPTNEIVIIPPLPRLSVETSWLSVTVPLEEDDSSADVTIPLDLLPGETRTETIRIEQLVLSAAAGTGNIYHFDGAKAGSDIKIDVQEVDAISNSESLRKPASVVRGPLVKYRGYLCMPLQERKEVAEEDITNGQRVEPKKVKVGHCEFKSLESCPTGGSKCASRIGDFSYFRDELKVTFSYPNKAVSVFLEIEVGTSFDRANLEEVSRWAKGGEPIRVVAALPSVYARRLTLRIDLVPQRGLVFIVPHVLSWNSTPDEFALLNKPILTRALQDYFSQEEAPDVETPEDSVSVIYQVKILFQ